LSQEKLTTVVDAAVARLESTEGEDAAALSDVTFEIVDLPGDVVGLAYDRHVQIDVDAAGFGWFVDATPADDTEFTIVESTHGRVALPDSPAYGHVDLLTAVMHELGHVLGHADDDGHALMESTLPLGTRRLPDLHLALETETPEFDGLAGVQQLDIAALDGAFAAVD
jgi:hypothetical protein